MDNSKITSLNDKHFLSVDEQIRLLQNRGFRIWNKVFFQWYLTKYNYQTLINGYNDFFLVDGLRPWNVYKKDAYSSDLIRLFEFDRNISRIILNDIQNIELFLQNSVIQAFAKTFEK
ncbi:hypothetical protein MSATCC14277_2270 [Metamycoplasma salivarium]|uniref:Abi family protein n=1 Tax=Metamycoplasma salivarium TaxID=2124 RepID=UPI002082599C|nr:Abi family protein [Metamycoplasma salivarium]GIZ05645.1 hypothetical protein MSATCC14277_2270 [Metamycoplasma salivarium]